MATDLIPLDPYQPHGVVRSGKVILIKCKVNLETNDFLSAADLGCPAIFEANLEKVSENGPDYRNDSLISNTSKKDQK